MGIGGVSGSHGPDINPIQNQSTPTEKELNNLFKKMEDRLEQLYQTTSSNDSSETSGAVKQAQQHVEELGTASETINNHPHLTPSIQGYLLNTCSDLITKYAHFIDTHGKDSSKPPQ